MKKEEPKTCKDQDVEEGFDKRRRQLLKLALGSAAAYTVPLMASFPMEGLRIGKANAGIIACETSLFPPGIFGANQTLVIPPGRAFSNNPQVVCRPQGRPFQGGSEKPMGPAPPFRGLT